VERLMNPGRAIHGQSNAAPRRPNGLG
jgi:hypothetical protein